MIVSMEVNETQTSSYHSGLLTSTNPDSSTRTEYTAEGGILSEDEDSPSGDDEQRATKSLTHLSPLLTKAKRSVDDIYHDTDLYPSKKRRKQSKPVRISSLLSGQCEKDSEDEDINKEDMLKSVSSNESFSNSHGGAVLSCDYCKERFDKTEQLKYHIHTVHTTKLFCESVNNCKLEGAREHKSEFPLNLSNVQESDSPQMEAIVRTWMVNDENKTNTSATVTTHTDTMHSMQQHNVFVDSNTSGSSYLQPDAHFLLPLLPHVSVHNQTSPVSQKGPNSMSTSIRIFNPDAFCHLCNKEFCNKYFLKTHKANKHGIYVDTIISSSFPSSVTPIGSSIPTYNTISAVNSQFIPQKNGECTSGLRYSGNLTMRASCDICHKRFCNKYFVRRHKAKIHGIVEDISLATTSSSFLSLPEYVLKQDTEEHENTSAGSDTGSNNLDCGIAENSDQKERHDNIENVFSYRTDMYFPANIKQEKDFESEDNLNCENNSVVSVNKMSPTSQMSKDSSFSTDQLKKLGVINADAFCEICCKEYCNKYFLRTHKMKRHGILITDNDGKDFKPCVSSNSSWVNIQTSPLNLIIGENGSSNFESAEKFRSELSDTDDYECDTCGCKFQNAQLMHMHRSYFHSEKSEDSASDQKFLNTFDKEEEDAILNCENNETCANQTVKKIVSNNNEENIADSSVKDSVNYDLQKLQTMIIQLNDLTVSKLKVCSICNKDFENSNYLRDHMIADHGAVIKKYDILPNENITTDNISFTTKTENLTNCFVCKKDFVSDDLLKMHMEEHHGHSSTNSCTLTAVTDSIKVDLENKECAEKGLCSQIQQGNFEKRISLTPTSSYCEICNKELCNKYFMKTHMQRMHGIEIENGAQIGGVICDICNKELCSKYFLRVHKQNTHGIIEDGSTSQSGRETLGIVTSNGNLQTENDQALKPSDVGDLSHRYFTHFTEVCPICNRRFRSTKWLKAHLLSDHGDSGIDKWNELEIQQLSHVQQNKSPQHAKPTPPLSSSTPLSSSPTLKIPSNWHGQHHEKQGTQFRAPSHVERHEEGNSNHVLSNLLGSVNSSSKNYRCSYCPFSTQVLAFLFVHEKSHTGLSSRLVSNTNTPIQCPVCFQSFQKADKFQHHFLTHQFSGLLHPLFTHTTTSAYSPPLESSQSVQVIPQHSLSTLEDVTSVSESYKQEFHDYQSEVAVPNEESWKFCCTFCFKRFKSHDILMEHVKSKHILEDKPTSTVSPSDVINNTTAYQKEYKCSHCKFSSTHMIILKKHIRSDHKSEYYENEEKSDERLNLETETEQRANDVKKRLEDAVQKSKLPASYAVPQSQSPCIDGFVMQPFLLEEPNRKFVPSLVFLPVKEKMSEPITVSFMLTPA